MSHSAIDFVIPLSLYIQEPESYSQDAGTLLCFSFFLLLVSLEVIEVGILCEMYCLQMGKPELRYTSCADGCSVSKGY